MMGYALFFRRLGISGERACHGRRAPRQECPRHARRWRRRRVEGFHSSIRGLPSASASRAGAAGYAHRSRSQPRDFVLHPELPALQIGQREAVRRGAAGLLLDRPFEPGVSRSEGGKVIVDPDFEDRRKRVEPRIHPSVGLSTLAWRSPFLGFSRMAILELCTIVTHRARHRHRGRKPRAETGAAAVRIP